ncbi:MAG: hypothetical protein AAFQ79_13805 [Pseudomonadota bacterium]
MDQTTLDRHRILRHDFRNNRLFRRDLRLIDVNDDIPADARQRAAQHPPRLADKPLGIQINRLRCRRLIDRVHREIQVFDDFLKKNRRCQDFDLVAKARPGRILFGNDVLNVDDLNTLGVEKNSCRRGVLRLFVQKKQVGEQGADNGKNHHDPFAAPKRIQHFADIAAAGATIVGRNTIIDAVLVKLVSIRAVVAAGPKFVGHGCSLLHLGTADKHPPRPSTLNSANFHAYQNRIWGWFEATHLRFEVNPRNHHNAFALELNAFSAPSGHHKPPLFEACRECTLGQSAT